MLVTVNKAIEFAAKPEGCTPTSHCQVPPVKVIVDIAVEFVELSIKIFTFLKYVEASDGNDNPNVNVDTPLFIVLL